MFIATALFDVNSFLQMGGFGVMALAFLMVLWLFLRSDKRANNYSKHLTGLIEELRKTHVNEKMLIDVVSSNTRAFTEFTAKLTAMADRQHDHSDIMRQLNDRLANWHCPYASQMPMPSGPAPARKTM